MRYVDAWDEWCKKSLTAFILHHRKMEKIRQNKWLALTGVSLNPDNAQLDHIIPIAMGGTNTKDNLQIIETKVNRMKGSLSNDEFIAICKQVAEWHTTPLQDGS